MVWSGGKKGIEDLRERMDSRFDTLVIGTLELGAHGSNVFLQFKWMQTSNLNTSENWREMSLSKAK